MDWSKLVNRPPVFEHATTKAEIKGFRDWSWQVCQYLATIDANYDEEVKKLFDDPSKGFDMSSASVETRTRSTKLYRLLASLVHGKSVNTIKSIGNSDGYEALRQMILSLRPNNNNRGLALLTAATSWPAFNMGPPLQPQILKLEEIFEESRKAGTEIQDTVKAAILMRCVTGQLRAYLNLGAQDNMQYTLREQCLRWDRAQQRWSGLVAADEQVIPMEVDRVKGKGKWNSNYGGQSKGYGSKGKGKGDKGYQKGKSDGKGKSKDAKGKSRKEMRKAKAKLTTPGSRAKERATNSAIHVASLDTSAEIAGRINRFVQFLRTQ